VWEDVFTAGKYVLNPTAVYRSPPDGLKSFVPKTEVESRGESQVATWTVVLPAAPSTTLEPAVNINDLLSHIEKLNTQDKEYAMAYA